MYSIIAKHFTVYSYVYAAQEPCKQTVGILNATFGQPLNMYKIFCLS